MSGTSTLAIPSFHHVGEPSPGGWETWFYIPERIFVAQLAYFRDNGWEVIDVGAFLRGITAPESLPPRAVLLTFDDGYRSLVDTALRWLRRFGYPAVVFVPSDFIGGLNSWDADSEPEEAICDWDDLRELERCGVSVQSHGASHRSFSGLSPVEQKQEVRRSKAALEAGLGKRVELFAYPYGDDGGSSPAAYKELRWAGYRAAFLYEGGPNSVPVADPYRLFRLAMGPDTDLEAALVLDDQGLTDL